MCHVTKKNTHRLYFVLFLITYHHHRHKVFESSGLRVFGSSVVVTAGVVGITRIAHETFGVADEVSAVIKSFVA